MGLAKEVLELLENIVLKPDGTLVYSKEKEPNWKKGVPHSDKEKAHVAYRMSQHQAAARAKASKEA